MTLARSRPEWRTFVCSLYDTGTLRADDDDDDDDEIRTCSYLVADRGGGSGDPHPPIRPEEFFVFSIIHSKTISRIRQNALFRA